MLEQHAGIAKRSDLIGSPSYANWAVGAILILLFLINLATSARLPFVSADEVYYADPGVTLALNGHFGSTAWWYQRGNEFWVGQPPGYSLLMAGWVSLLGFDVTIVRALNYVIITIVAVALLLSFRRIGKPHRGFIDVCLLLLFLGGAGVSFDFREARPDTLGMLVGALILAAAVFARSWLRLFLLAAVAAIAPFVSLPTVAYIALGCILWLLVMRSNVREIAAVAAGTGLGSLGLLTLYAAMGKLGIFLEHLPETAQDGAVPIKYVYFSDRSLLPALIAVALFWLAARRRVPQARLRFITFLVVLSIATPVALAIVGKFPLTYAWMAYSPAVIAAMLLMREISWSDIDRLGRVAVIAAAFLLVVAAAMFPARLVVTALEWQGRSYKAVESFIDERVTSIDVAYSDFRTYYPVRTKARTAYFGKYILLLSPDEKAAVTVLILNRNNVDRVVALMGGHWIETASFRSVLASIPRQLGFGERGYDFVVMRRSDAKTGT